MKTVVCYKWVVNDDAVSINDSGEVEIRNPQYDVSPYDRNAIEAGVQLAEKTNGVCVALSAGDQTLAKSNKATLSSGPSAGYVVIDPAMAQADCAVAANVISAAIRKIGDTDLVLCSEASSDTFAQQMAPRIAKELGWPVVTYVKSIVPEEDSVIVERELETCVEKLEVQLPAVLSILGDSNNPRMPKLKDVMGAGKKPFTIWSCADLDGPAVDAKLSEVSVSGNSTERKNIICAESSKEETVSRLVKYLIEEGVVS